MANVTHNPIKSTKFHNSKNVNKREKRGSQVMGTCVESDTAFAITTEDGIDFVRNTGAVSITLPPAAENKGRCLKFIQTDTAQLTIVQNADGAFIDGVGTSFTQVETAEDWIELYCTGAAWIIVSRNFTTL